jgi:hypothetical protein
MRTILSVPATASNGDSSPLSAIAGIHSCLALLKYWEGFFIS